MDLKKITLNGSNITTCQSILRTGSATWLWQNYSAARNEMLLRTDFNHAPWFIVNAEDKKQAHIALISHLLSRIAYPKKIRNCCLLIMD